MFRSLTAMKRTVLALETATHRCSVALLREAQVVVHLTLARPRAHAEWLVPLVAQALQYEHLLPTALDAVAVSKGPGSYTGLRIGVSTAKGLVFATGAALVGIPSLEALAASVAPQASPGDLVLPAFHARQEEVYAACWQAAPDETLRPVAPVAVLTPADVPTFLAHIQPCRIWLAGDGAALLHAPLHALGHAPRLLDPQVFAPDAAWVGRLALPRLAQGQTEDPATFEPHYLKEFIARKPLPAAASLAP